MNLLEALHEYHSIEASAGKEGVEEGGGRQGGEHTHEATLWLSLTPLSLDLISTTLGCICFPYYF